MAEYNFDDMANSVWLCNASSIALWFGLFFVVVVPLGVAVNVACRCGSYCYSCSSYFLVCSFFLIKLFAFVILVCEVPVVVDVAAVLEIAVVVLRLCMVLCCLLRTQN